MTRKAADAEAADGVQIVRKTYIACADSRSTIAHRLEVRLRAGPDKKSAISVDLPRGGQFNDLCNEILTR